jgi:heme-degrading monooxygenase HmoA
MHARVSTYQSPPDQLTDPAVENMKEELLPRVFEMDGNRGAVFLVDRQTGKTISITLWESAEAMRASEERGSQVREDAAETTSAQVGDVERFEAPVVELR